MRSLVARFGRPLALSAAAGVVALPVAVGGVVAPSVAAGPARVTLEGHGYGHGIGMSQYGAYGAAREGLGQRRIMAFYYPGTGVGRAAGQIRVHLSADTDGDTVVSPRSRLRVRDLRAGRTRALPDNGARLWRLTAAPGGGTQVSWRGPKRWRAFTRLPGGAEFTARGGGITLHTASGTRDYRGSLRRTPAGTVNVLGLDNYLKGVVPLEMPATWHREAVKAQAVAARSYATWERANPRGTHFDVYDTVSSQVYGGRSAEHPASNNAVKATAGEIRTWRGRAAFTQFSSSNGGFTAPGSQPYLTARRDPYDGWSGNTNHDWRATVTDDAIERAWPTIGDFRRLRVVRRDGHGEWNGRALDVRVVGSASTIVVSGPDVRFALGLKSNWFRVV